MTSANSGIFISSKVLWYSVSKSASLVFISVCTSASTSSRHVSLVKLSGSARSVAACTPLTPAWNVPAEVPPAIPSATASRVNSSTGRSPSSVPTPEPNSWTIDCAVSVLSSRAVAVAVCFAACASPRFKPGRFLIPMAFNAPAIPAAPAAAVQSSQVSSSGPRGGSSLAARSKTVCPNICIASNIAGPKKAPTAAPVGLFVIYAPTPAPAALLARDPVN